MPRAPKTRAAQLGRHLDGIAVWSNEHTTGEVLTRLHGLVNTGREIQNALTVEDEADQIIEEARSMIADLERVNPAMAAKMRQAMESSNESPAQGAKEQAGKEVKA